MRTRPLADYPRYAERKNSEELSVLEALNVRGVPDLSYKMMNMREIVGPLSVGGIESLARNFLCENNGINQVGKVKMEQVMEALMNAYLAGELPENQGRPASAKGLDAKAKLTLK